MTIALIDDHQILNDSLKNLFITNNDFTLVKTFNSGEDFFLENQGFIPDVIISDLNMPKMNGIQLVERCRKTNDNNVKIIILSMINDTQTIKRLMRIGADGFISKATSYSELLIGINSVLSGKKYISKDLHDLMIDNMFTQEQVVYHLSPRENEVLKKICQGQTVKEIAFDMKLSSNTVQYYYKCIMNKFKLKRNTDLIVFAIKNGLYSPIVEV